MCIVVPHFSSSVLIELCKSVSKHIFCTVKVLALSQSGNYFFQFDVTKNVILLYNSLQDGRLRLFFLVHYCPVHLD